MPAGCAPTRDPIPRSAILVLVCQENPCRNPCRSLQPRDNFPPMIDDWDDWFWTWFCCFLSHIADPERGGQMDRWTDGMRQDQGFSG